jgi:hypothetical protein
VAAADFDSWSNAPACTYKGIGIPDKLGRSWGFQGGQSCAFRGTGAAAAPAPPPAWDAGKECSYRLTDSNSLTDKAGRRWGYENGVSCTFKTQILSTVAPKPPPPRESLWCGWCPSSLVFGCGCSCRSSAGA